MSLLEATSVKVSYGSAVALNGFSVTASAGEGVALLGLNGAGKTSALRAFFNMIPYQGRISWFDSPGLGAEKMRRLGFAPEDAAPPDFLTIAEYLEFIASFRVRSRADQKSEAHRWMKLFELSPVKRISACSKGMRRRVVLAQALMGKPEVVVLDEPLNGLDPVVIIRLREELVALRNSGVLLVYSSHILAEVERTCSRAIFLRNGNVTKDISMEDVLQQQGGLEKAFTTFAAREEVVL